MKQNSPEKKQNVWSVDFQKCFHAGIPSWHFQGHLYVTPNCGNNQLRNQDKGKKNLWELKFNHQHKHY